MAGYWIGVFPAGEANSSQVVFSIFASIAISVVWAFFLFSGLQDIASKLGDEKLETRLFHCFFYICHSISYFLHVS